MAVLQSQLKIGVIDAASSKLRAISAQLNAFQARNRSMMAPFTGMIGRLAAFGGAYLGVTQGFSKTVTAAREMQASLTEIGIKADLSGSQITALRNRVLALSPTVNQSTAELLTGIDTMVGLGLSASDAAAAIPAIGKAATATGATMADLSAATVSAMQNLKVPASEIPKMLDAMAFAGNRGAFELRDMAREIPSLGAAYQGLGQSGVPAVTDLAAALQIVRKGTGDSSSAATNLTNILQKVNAPQTRAAFKKMGVNLSREMTKASKNGMTPIEAIAEVTNRTLKGDLSKLGDLFADAQVQQGLRPLIQNMEEYRRIRDQAAGATGTIADAFAARMGNADEKIKAFQIRINNLGASVGTKLMAPLGDVAEHLTHVFDTLDKRVGVFDRIGAAMKGLTAGLGFDSGMLKQITDLLFGAEGKDGVDAGERLGRITKNFREFGESVRSVADAVSKNPIAKFLGEMSGYGLKLFISAAAIGAVASAMMRLAQAALALSGITTAFKIIKALTTIGGSGLKPPAGPPSSPTSPKPPANWKGPWGESNPGQSGPRPGPTGPRGLGPQSGPKPPEIPVFMRAINSLWTAAAAAASLNLAQSDMLKTTSEIERWKSAQAAIKRQFPLPIGPSHGEERERDDSVRGWQGISNTLNPPTAPTVFDKFLSGMDFAAALQSTTVKTSPTGVQQVQVTNPTRPNVTVSVGGVHVTTNADPAAIGDAVGERVKAAVEGHFGDGGGGL